MSPLLPGIRSYIMTHRLLDPQTIETEGGDDMAYKSARSGRFVTKKHAQKSPATTYKLGRKKKSK